ncbi:MAG: FAD-binding oxidoreductase [Clostridia bacterium]|nr:MAG: FAD-binding oxidoreductase [Clostridia bacterium]
MPSSDRIQALAANIKKYSSAELKTDLASRILYSTDASIYKVMPLAVVIPRHEDDVIATVEACIEHDLPIVPRGGGSSLAGQTVGEAVVIDFSKYLDRIFQIDARQRRVRVQPGRSLDSLNRELRRSGLMIGPDPASGNRAVVGGIVGNNSTGSHSIVYGRLVDHTRALRVVLADGRDVRLGPVSWREAERRGQGADLEAAIYRTLPALIRHNAQLIDDKFPKYWRRSGGYNLDYLRRQLTGDLFNPAPLLAGSEGTLAIFLEAELDLVPIPRYKALAVLSFDDYDQAFRAVPGLLELHPSAVELMDDLLIRLTRESTAWRKRLTFVQGNPKAILFVEFAGDEKGYVEDRMQALSKHWQRTGHLHEPVIISDAAAQANVWEVRKAGLNILSSMRGDNKPTPGIEDVAVPPENLADYMAELRQAIDGRGLVAAMYAHASAGCIHTRPILNLKTDQGVSTLIELIRHAARLAKKYGGVPSSEHGDGLARSHLNPDFFGPEIYQLFVEIKRTFDPDTLLNPHKVVDPLPPEQNLRYGPDYHTLQIQPVWDWSRDGSYAQAVEMCNGSGVCRKLDVGTMCPSFQATRDEQFSTRGRANLLRAALSGDLPGGLENPDLYEALDLCLGCKACKSECPSSVDMTKLKTEAYAQKYQQTRPPLHAWVFGHIHELSWLGANFAPLSNWLLRLAPVRWMMQKALHLHPNRGFPAFQRQTFTARFRKHQAATPAAASGPRVVLLADTFTQYNDPDVGMAAVRVLESAGLEVVVTAPMSSGRPALSQGLVPYAQKAAARVIDALLPYAEAGVPVIGLEPSSALTIRDDYPDLLPGEPARAVAANIYLFDEYLTRLLEDNPRALPLQRENTHFLVHGHCHQKSLVGEEPLFKVLNAIPGTSVSSTDAGCCGMAGAFGYDAEHYDVSVAIANDRMIPSIKAHPNSVVVANGTSCRHQIVELTGRESVHLAVALAEALGV